MRTLTVSHDEYETAWLEILERIEAEIAAGEVDPSAIVDRVVDSVSLEFLTSAPFLKYYQRMGVVVDPQAGPLARLAVEEGAYKLVSIDSPGDERDGEEVAAFIMQSAEPYDHIVELGSGVGRNLVAVRRALPQDYAATYHACELTETGRVATERLASLDGGWNVHVHAFNYYEPDLSFLEGSERVLFFTVHSIEQIPVLGRNLFDEMLRCTASCHGFHLEPFGWQDDPALLRQSERYRGAMGPFLRWKAKVARKLARQIDRICRTSLKRPFAGVDVRKRDLGRTERVSLNAAAWSRRQDYNTNGLPLLRSLQAEGLLTVEGVDVNTYGINPFTPTTLVAWASVQQA